MDTARGITVSFELAGEIHMLTVKQYRPCEIQISPPSGTANRRAGLYISLFGVNVYVFGPELGIHDLLLQIEA